MAHYNTVFHTLAKILPRHEIDRLDRKYGQGDRRRKTSRYAQFIVMFMAQILGLKSYLWFKSDNSRPRIHANISSNISINLCKDVPWNVSDNVQWYRYHGANSGRSEGVLAATRGHAHLATCRQ